MKYIVKPISQHKPVASWDEERPLVLNPMVYEPVDDTVFTGLLDDSGNELHRNIRHPIGFIKS